jgi:hypothetical protein
MWDMAGKSDLEVDVEKAWEKVNSQISKKRIRISKTLLGVFTLMVLTLTFLKSPKSMEMLEKYI